MIGRVVTFSLIGFFLLASSLAHADPIDDLTQKGRSKLAMCTLESFVKKKENRTCPKDAKAEINQLVKVALSHASKNENAVRAIKAYYAYWMSVIDSAGHGPGESDVRHTARQEEYNRKLSELAAAIKIELMQ